MALVRWRVHRSTPHEDNLDHVLGRRERMWREGVSQERVKYRIRRKLDRQRQADARSHKSLL